LRDSKKFVMIRELNSVLAIKATKLEPKKKTLSAS